MDAAVRAMRAAAAQRRRIGRGIPAFPATAVSQARALRVGWICAVLALTVAAFAFGHAHRGPVPPFALILAIAATAPLLVARRSPFTVLCLVLAVDAVFVIWGRLPWPPTVVIAWLFALAACPVLLPRPHALVLLTVTEAAVLAAVVVPASVNPRPWDASITEALAVLLVWGGADALRSRRESKRLKMLADEQMRGLHEREAVGRLRAEIARELHDVVAHHVSLIAVRAATAPYQLGEVAGPTTAAFAEIATEARAALDDLRTVLGVLRAPDGHGSHAPQPCLVDVPDLLQRLQSNGMTVTYTEHGRRRPLGAVTELSCYRVIQEALTNAARHAPGSSVAVAIDYRDTEVVLAISDSGQAAPPIASAASGDGYGLIGMHERVRALGGHLTATHHGNGFLVEAQIPISTTGQIP